MAVQEIKDDIWSFDLVIPVTMPCIAHATLTYSSGAALC